MRIHVVYNYMIALSVLLSVILCFFCPSYYQDYDVSVYVIIGTIQPGFVVKSGLEFIHRSSQNEATPHVFP